MQQVVGRSECGHGFGLGIEKEQAVGQRKDAAQLVADHHHRGAQVVAQVADEVVQVGRREWVQTGRGFVEKQQRWVECKRARNRGALAHAAAELCRLGLKALAQADQRELEARRLLAGLRVERGEQLQRQHHVFAHGHAAPQGAGLKRHTKALAQRAQGLRIGGIQVLRAVQHLAGGGCLQADEVAQQGAFAATAAACNGQHLAGQHVKREVALHNVVAKGHGQALHADQRSSHRVTSPVVETPP